MNMFSDCEWGKKVKDRHGRVNQLDVSLIYKAQMAIIECKTGNDSFESKTFQTIESISNALGGSFVTKLLVTSLAKPNEEVLSRANSSRIRIISRDDLPNIGEKLAEIIVKEIKV